MKLFILFSFFVEIEAVKILMGLPKLQEARTWSGQWRSQEFRLGGARLKDKIGNKKLININNKISKQLYDNIIVKQNLK